MELDITFWIRQNIVFKLILLFLLFFTWLLENFKLYTWFALCPLNSVSLRTAESTSGREPTSDLRVGSTVDSIRRY